MADEQLIKPRELPAAATVFADDAIMTDDGVTVGKATPVQIVNAGAPVPTEAEAIAGSDNSKRMTPLTVKQVLDNVTAPSVLRAQAWAESDSPPNPGIPGSMSAKSWAAEAERLGSEQADRAEAAADRAALNNEGVAWFDDVASLKVSNILSYSDEAGKVKVTEGDVIRTRLEGYTYSVASPTAGDYDEILSGDVKLDIVVQRGEIWDGQFFESNDADRLNKAIRKAITFADAGQLYKVIVHGLYNFDKPLRAFKFDGGSFSYASLTIEAPAHGYVNGKRTEFRFNNAQNPGVVTQSIRQLTIKNVAIIGAANDLTLPSYEELLNRDGWWNTNGAVESGKFKLHAGICVDPFYENQPNDEKFSEFDGSEDGVDYYVAGIGAGSTQILIEDCDIQGWVAGVMCSGSAIQIGDSITVVRCNLSYNRYPFLIGESQNRGCVMIDCHVKGFDALMVGGEGFGSGTGSLGYIRGGVYVFGYAIVLGEVSRGNGSVCDAYFESIWTIGHISGRHGFSFRDCQIKLIDGATEMLPNPDVHLSGGGSVNFFGGYIGKYNTLPRRLNISTTTVFSGATFDNIPFFTDQRIQAIHDMPLRYANTGPVRDVIVSDIAAALNVGRSGAGTRIISDTDEWTNVSQWDAINHGSGVITKGANGSAVVTGLDLATIQVGDEIGVVTPWSGKNNDGTTASHVRTGIGLVESIVGTDVHLKGVVKNLPDGTYSFRTLMMPLMHQITFCDTTSGSPTLTNVSPSGAWRVGAWVKGSGIPANTRVISATSTTITLSRNATATATGVEIFDARMVLTNKFLTAAPSTGHYPRGAFVKNSAPSLDANNKMLAGWLCVVGGSPGTWQPVYWPAVS